MPKKQQEKKKAPKATSREDELRATVKELRASLKRAETQASKWKQRAKAHGAAVTDARGRMQKLEKRLAKASRESKRAVERVKDTAAEVVTVTATAIDPAESTAPSPAWTVTRLRAEARQQGVAGYSRMTKAELLAALS